VNGAALVLVVLALVQVMVASLFLTGQDEIVRSLATAMPGAPPGQLDDRFFATVAEGILVHAMLTVVYLAGAWVVRKPAASVRLFVTALAIVAMLTDGLILGQLPTLLPGAAQIISGAWAGNTILRLVVIGLLWLPASSRRWFAGRSASAV
jgi:hypothetical protein